MSEIVNVELHNRAATLHEPTGPVVGFDNVGITSQKVCTSSLHLCRECHAHLLVWQWEIRNIGVNRTTIQNVLTKTFARVNFEADVRPIGRGRIRLIWNDLTGCSSHWK